MGRGIYKGIMGILLCFVLLCFVSADGIAGVITDLKVA
jgi:hypothetical protein